MTVFTKNVFYQLLLTKPSTWRNDADDGGDGDGAPTTLATWPSPFLNARRDKISRARKPLTLIIKNWSKFDFDIKNIENPSILSAGPGFIV